MCTDLVIDLLLGEAPEVGHNGEVFQHRELLEQDVMLSTDANHRADTLNIPYVTNVLLKR